MFLFLNLKKNFNSTKYIIRNCLYSNSVKTYNFFLKRKKRPTRQKCQQPIQVKTALVLAHRSATWVHALSLGQVSWPSHLPFSATDCSVSHKCCAARAPIHQAVRQHSSCTEPHVPVTVSTSCTQSVSTRPKPLP